MPSRPIEEGLFSWPPGEAPSLIGARCGECQAMTFPASVGCPRCGSDAMASELLARRGTLYTWTTQEFLPKAPYAGPETPQTFEPWAVGYVELGGEIRVEGRLYDVDPAALDFGVELEVVVRPFTVTEDGDEVVTFGFAPVGGLV